MNKPDSLRAYLTAAIPVLKREPERLQLYIDKGRVISTGTGSVSFQYAYRLNLVLLDFPGHPDEVFLPLLLWASINQRELLQSMTRGEGGIEFEADILSPTTADLSIYLDLTERVIATAMENSYTLTHPDEPPVDPGFGPWPDTIPAPGALVIVLAGPQMVIPPPELDT